MKKALKIALLVFAIVFVGIQFFQIDKTNPEIVKAETLESLVNVPSDVSIILGKACNDCHTNKTRYPWYSYVQPSGWFLKDHVEHGKEHFNMSKFATYDANKQAKRLEEMCEEVTEGNMPLPSYTWIHREAVLTETEKKALCDWTATVAQARTK